MTSINYEIIKSKPWLERLLICLAVLISYASVWPNEFVFDDKCLIMGNGFLRQWSSLPQLLTNPGFADCGMPGGFHRPLQMLVYFLIFQAFGASTAAFHTLNVALQALNACLLHHFGVRAGFRKGAAFAAALLWAVHPLHTSMVAYMPSTAELLWGCFCLLGLMTLLPDFTPRKIWQSMIFFILALGCKESAVVFPALAMATLFFTDKNRAQFSLYLKTWPLWLLAAGFIAAWLLFIHTSGYSLDKSGVPAYAQDYTSNFTNRVLTCLATLPVYARLIIWPMGLHIERSFYVFSKLLEWPPLMGVLPAVGALMVGLALLQIGRAKRGVALSFGLLWFAAALSPYTGIIFPIDSLIAEGWLYMPTMGLFLGVAQTAAGLFKKRQKEAQLIVLVLVFLLGSMTFFQNKAWRNPETLYQNILQNGGHIDRITYQLGVSYLEQGEFDKAIRLFQSELDHRPRSMWADIHMQLAIARLHIIPDKNDSVTLSELSRALPSSSHITEAIGELGQSLQADPEYYQAHMVLAAIYRYQGDSQMADFHQRQAEAILQKQGKP